MTWFRVDDSFWRHPKVRKLGRDKVAAVGLWALSGNWAADNVDSNVADGFVPWEVIEGFGDTRRRVAQRLIAVGLWEPVTLDGESGILFHDWSGYNPTKESREAERRAWRERKTVQRTRKNGHETVTSRKWDARTGHLRDFTEQLSTGTDEPPVDSPHDNETVSTPGQKDMSHRDTTGTPPRLPGESPGSHADVRYPSRPVPSRSSYVGGERSGNVRPQVDQRPPDRCPKHANIPDPPACGACADARRAASAWDTAAEQARKRAVHACRLCDGDGWRYETGRKIPAIPYIRCDHQRQPATA